MEPSAAERTKLRDLLIENYNMDDLITLAVDVGTNPKYFSQGNIGAFAQDLIFYCERQGMFKSLKVEAIKPKRRSKSKNISHFGWFGFRRSIPSHFVGREQDLQQLKARIGINKNERSQLTIIQGLPGIGKSAIVLTLAYEEEIPDVLPDGVLWIDLGNNNDLIQELTHRLEDLGENDLDQITTIRDLTARLIATLRDKQMLLIIDDVWKKEHALPFLAAGINCTKIFTTRFYDVADALATSSTDIYKLSVLTNEKALELLKELTPDTVKENRKESEILIQELDGLPLAIQVAGRLLRSEIRTGLGVENLIAELRNGAKILTNDAPTDLADISNLTTPTVAALFKKSTDTLSEKVRENFVYLGAIIPKQATFDKELIAAVWAVEDPIPTIRILVERGLLEPSEKRFQRFQIHGLLTDFTRYLTLTDNASTRLNNIYTYMWRMTKFLANNVTNIMSHREGLILDQRNMVASLVWAGQNKKWNEYADLLIALQRNYTILDQEYKEEHVRSLTKWIKKERKESKLVEIALALSNFMDVRGHWEGWLELFEQTLQYAELESGDIHGKKTLAELELSFGLMQYRVGRFQEAETRLARSNSLAEELKDKDLGHKSTYYRGLVKIDSMGDFDSEVIYAAIGFFEESLKLAQELKNTVSKIANISQIGKCYSYLGEHDKAQEYFNQCSSYLKRKEPAIQRAVAHVYNFWGIDYFDQSYALMESKKAIEVKEGKAKLKQARKKYRKARKLSQQSYDRLLTAQVLTNLAEVAQFQGKINKAHNFIKEARRFSGLTLPKELQFFQAQVLGNLAESAQMQGNIEEAFGFIQEARAFPDLILPKELQFFQCQLVTQFANEKFGQGDSGAASEYLKYAREITKSLEKQLGKENKSEALEGLKNEQSALKENLKTRAA